MVEKDGVCSMAQCGKVLSLQAERELPVMLRAGGPWTSLNQQLFTFPQEEFR